MKTWWVAIKNGFSKNVSQMDTIEKDPSPNAKLKTEFLLLIYMIFIQNILGEQIFQ